jgi:hypothetical protein
MCGFERGGLEIEMRCRVGWWWGFEWLHSTNSIEIEEHNRMERYS